MNLNATDLGQNGKIDPNSILCCVGADGLQRVLDEGLTGKANGHDRGDAKPDRKSKSVSGELLWLKDIQLPSSNDYVIKHLLHRGDLGLLYGGSGSGKTFFYVDLIMHSGTEWRGKRVHRGGVLVLCLEGQRGFKSRIIAQQLQHRKRDINLDDFPLAMRFMPVDFCKKDGDAKAVIEIVKNEFDEMPSLIVVDTLARAMGGGNENSPDDMGSLIKNLALIQKETGAQVLVIHHTGKDKERGARGHNSLWGAADTVIEIERPSGQKNSVATVRKQKDGPEGDRFAFKLEEVELGEDEDGDPMTSCVMVPIGDSKSQKTTRRAPKNKNGIALDLLRKALVDAGEPAPGNNHIPGQVRVVRLETWERYCDIGDLSTSKIKDSKKKAFNRARESLQTTDFIGVWNGFVWLTE